MSTCVICKQTIPIGQEIVTELGLVHYGHCYDVFCSIPVTENKEDQNSLVESTELLL